MAQASMAWWAVWALLVAGVVVVGWENGLARSPPMGWNSWNHFGCNIDERTVQESADALVASGLAEAGYVYLNIDDCWADRERDGDGRLVARHDTFPSGMKATADYAHSRGLKLGIYSDAGFYSCEGQPGSLGMEDRDAASFASWEIDYLKYDNCYNDGSPARERYTAMRDALNRTGRPILFSMCEWGEEEAASWGRDVGNSWRTTGDIRDRWESVMSIAAENERWAGFAGPGGWNDPDMLEVGNGGMSWEEYRSHFSLWAIIKAPLLIGGDVRNMSLRYLRILLNQDVIAVNQDPTGVQGRRLRQHQGSLDLWAAPLSHSRLAVLLLNPTLQPALMSLSLQDLGFPLHTSANVRDLWEQQDHMLPHPHAHIQALIPSHGVKMYTITPSTNKQASRMQHPFFHSQTSIFLSLNPALTFQHMQQSL